MALAPVRRLRRLLRRRRARPEAPGAASLDLTPPPPATVFVIINRTCNLRCKMCDVGQRVRDSQFYQVMSPPAGRRLDAPALRRLIDQVRGFRPRIAVTSTEPLLAPELFDFARQATAAGMAFQVTTNGLLLPDCAEEVVDSGVDSLWVSLDGPPELHNRIRGHGESFQRAVEGMRKVRAAARARRRAVRLSVNFTCSNHNAGALTPFLESLRDVPVDEVVASHMNYVTQEMADAHNALHGAFCAAAASSVAGADPRAADLDAMWDDLRRARRRTWPFRLAVSPELDRRGLEDFYRRPEVIVGPGRCRAAWTIAQLAANGDWVVSTRCFPKVMGNLYEQSFMDTWHGPAYRAFRAWLRDHALSPACRRCCGAL